MSATSNSSLIHTRPRIGITIGDAAGIGPEIVLKSLSDQNLRQNVRAVVIGDGRVLQATAESLGIKIAFKEFASDESSGGIELVDLKNLTDDVQPGEESAATGAASGQFIEKAVELWRSGAIDAIATAPISKKALNAGGYDFPGHTEFLAKLTDTRDFAMSFFAGKLRVVLLSTHLSLVDAIGLVKRENLVPLIEFTSSNLASLLKRPVKIAVAGLNPHASEGGMFGSEEANEIIPAVEHCRTTLGIDVSGPYSPDTIFLRGHRGDFDAVIACYHDQATIAVKSISFGSAVNVTLGLPLIRTSVDHGTAVDIAGKGIADASSMTAAIELAGELVRVQIQAAKI
jgi:4-hydroxythreonine-4-phosphate dehydrogenase